MVRCLVGLRRILIEFSQKLFQISDICQCEVPENGNDRLRFSCCRYSVWASGHPSTQFASRKK